MRMRSSRLGASAARTLLSSLSSRTIERTFCSRACAALPRPQLLGALTEHDRGTVLQGIFTQCWMRPNMSSLRLISSTTIIQHQEIGMPSLSPTMTQGNIAKWRKKEGDQVAAGDVLCEIETDKATLEMESMEDGFLAKILRGDGSKDIPVGEPIAVVVESADEVGDFKDYKPTSDASSKATPSPPKSEDVPKTEASEPPKAETSKPAPPKDDGRLKLAEEKKVPSSDAKGPTSAPAAKPAEKPLQSLDFTDIPNTQIRRITAQRLLLSKQTIPHYYLTIDACVDKLLVVRSKLNTLQEASGGKKISINDVILKAAARALKKVPECNSLWTDNFIRQYHNVNIGVAVQTDYGLLVPVVKNADQKGLATVAEEVKTLAEKAKQNSLKPADYEGGTFTVSNLGGPFGIKQFCAIVNPPQACILAVGTADKRVMANPEGGFSASSFMSVTLSCDHRVVDGAIGARWLGAFKGYIEDPSTLIL